MIRRSVIIAGLLFALSSAMAVYAHPQIVSVEPAPNARLEQAPERVRITFNEPIEDAFASIQVLDATGRAVDRGDGRRAQDDPTTLSASLPLLEPGVYTVVWQVVGRDGHLVKGNFAFSIAGAPSGEPSPFVPSPPPTTLPTEAGHAVDQPAPSRSSDPLPDAALAVLRSVMLIGAVVAVGGMFCLYVIAVPGNGRFTRRMYLLVVGALLTLLVATLAFFAVHTLAIAGRITPDALVAVARDTRLGQALVARAILTLITLLLSNQRPRWAPALSGVLILLTFSVSGHPAATETPLTSILLDWIHLAAAAIWVGGLAALALALLQTGEEVNSAPDLRPFRTALTRFSRLALGSVAALAISGVIAALSYLRTVSDLWLTDYGRALLAKSVLFGILIGFGAYHALLLRRETAWHTGEKARALVRRFRRSLPLEATIAIVVAGIAGVLTSLPLPGAVAMPTPAIAPTVVASIPTVIVTPTPLPPPTPQPFIATQPAGDLRVTLRIEPAAPGRNQLRILITDAQNRPRDVQRVRVTLRMRDRDIGETSVIAESDGRGTYVVGNQVIGIAGVWQVQVQVRRVDADDVTADFQLLIDR
ncbi:MAG: copper resistance protein CopC/CopD [Roseiflexus sp.]|nr:copper resistance protein CopC/CopD [Roseiflexus sp.]